jgi:hypothetical protein
MDTEQTPFISPKRHCYSFVTVCAAATVLRLGLPASSGQMVTSTADSGAGTLRGAIASASNGATITFSSGLSGATITLASTLAINTSVSIDASALAGGIQINGNGSVEIFNVASGITVSLNSLILTNGSNGTNGGAIWNSGTLTLTNCVVSRNSSKSAFGGGIYNTGTLTLNECSLSNNSAYYDGGAIHNYQGSVTLNQCLLSGNDALHNFGGAIYNNGTLVLNQCALSGNIADESATGSSEGEGGAVFNANGLPTSQSTATLNECTLSGNSAMGNPYSGGGGVYNNAYGTMTLNECTVSGNTAYDCGGVCNGATMSLNGCTISGNTAALAGGGFETASGTATITNTIIAGNNGTVGADVVYEGAANYGGSNLVGSVYYLGTGTNYGPAPMTNAPDLAPLGNYGGPTLTMPPLAGSPAIGAGSVAANTFTSDQRGYPRVAGAHVDIGAVEDQTAPANNRPLLRNPAWLSTGGSPSFQFTFTGVTNADFTVLSSTNAALPLSAWTVLGNVPQNAPGHYEWTNNAATNRAQFYDVVSP